jgi:hypothetical protein
MEEVMLDVGLRPCAKNGQETSSAADRKRRVSGAQEKQMIDALKRLIAVNCAVTNQELAEGDPKLVHIYGRRLSDLREQELVYNPGKKICSLTGHKVLTWLPTEKGIVLVQ